MAIAVAIQRRVFNGQKPVPQAFRQSQDVFVVILQSVSNSFSFKVLDQENSESKDKKQ